jgi:hypothetical protein
VLGAKPRLLHRRGDGVQWAPADELCVAGEVLVAESEDGRWYLRGEVVELEPADGTGS